MTGSLASIVTGAALTYDVPYGHTCRRAGLTCVSRVTGITCRNGRGHGLFISRRSWRAW